MSMRVALWNGVGKFATVEQWATRGATVGTNVFNADGTLYVPATPAAAGETRLLWDLVLDIPANVLAVAALAGDGLVRKSGAAWSAVDLLAGDGIAIGADGLTIHALDPLSVYVTDPDGNYLTDPDGGLLQSEGPSTTNLPEGTNLYYTPERADERVAAGITALKAEADPFPQYTTAAEATAASPIQSVNGETGAVSLSAADVGADPSGTAAALVPKGYIDGLTMRWVSGSQVNVTSGAAYLESGGILHAAADIVKSGLSLAASSWHHLYLYSNAGTPDIEVSTTAPAAPFRGTARSKTGDSTRRYIGSVRTDGAGAIWEFQHAGDRVTYLENIDVLPFRVVVAGSSTIPATVSNADSCPETATAVSIFGFNASGVNHLKLSAADGPTLPGGFMAFVPASTAMLVDRMPLNAAREYVYAYDDAGGSCFLYAAGYFFER